MMLFEDIKNWKVVASKLSIEQEIAFIKAKYKKVATLKSWLRDEKNIIISISGSKFQKDDSYLNAFRIFTFHIASKYAIERNGSNFTIITDARLMDSNKNPDEIKDQDVISHNDNYDYSDEIRFEKLFNYVLNRYLGQGDKQKQPPIVKFAEANLKKPLLEDFKIKVNGSISHRLGGYVKDFSDQVKNIYIKTSRSPFIRATEVKLKKDRMTGPEYLCIQLCIKDEPLYRISEIAGISEDEVKEHINSAAHKVAKIIAEDNYKKYEYSITNEKTNFTIEEITELILRNLKCLY